MSESEPNIGKQAKDIAEATNTSVDTVQKLAALAHHLVERGWDDVVGIDKSAIPFEIARVGDDARMDEIKRKVASGKAFGTGVRLVTPAEIKEKFPLIEEDMVRGGMWDPDAGLVVEDLQSSRTSARALCRWQRCPPQPLL
jgi:glycine/D-amino acid oxidase-like deaminating enzyme